MFNADQMSEANQVKLRFQGVEFPIVNFKSQRPITNGSEKGIINVDIKPKVFYPKEAPEKFSIIQEVTVAAEGLFELYIVAVGSFSFSGHLDQDTKDRFVNMNATAIMFPYIRSFITTLTANLGETVTGAIVIPPKFFRGEVQKVDSLITNKDSEQ